MPKKYTGVSWNVFQPVDAASANVFGNEYAENTIVFTDEAELNHKIKTVSSELTLTDALETNQIFSIEVSHTLDLDYFVSKLGAIYVRAANNLLTLTQETDRNLFVLRVTSELNLTQSFTTKQPYEVSASNTLQPSASEIDTDELLALDPYDPEAVAALLDDTGLRQSVGVKKRQSLSTLNYLSFSQQAAPTAVGEASNHIQLGYTLEVPYHFNADTFLNLNQAVVGWLGQAASDQLTFTQTLISNGVVAQAVTSSLELLNVVSYYTVDFCHYNLGVGAGSFDVPAPSPYDPILIRRSTTILTWPYTTPTLTLELRNPNFDNVEQFEPRRINRRTRGGKLEVFRDINWPDAQRLIFTFSSLCEQTVKDLLYFMHWSLGKEIGVLDFESRQWKGIILTPSEAISEPGVSGFSAGFELEITN